MQLFYCPDILEGDTSLNAEESKHCVKVLRKKKGDHINVTDGSGHFFECFLDEINIKKCTFHVAQERTVELPGFSIHIAISPTKSLDRIEWFVEKAVEIGIEKISFIQSGFSERKHLNLDRLNKKAISAMKQSGRATLPQINGMTKLSSFVNSCEAEQKFVAHLDDTQTKHLISLAKPKKSYLVVIGPEGGFSSQEINLLQEKNFRKVKIGDYRLRTETAGITVCTTLNNINHFI